MICCSKETDWICSQVEEDRKHTSGEKNMKRKGYSNILKGQIFLKELSNNKQK